MRGVGRVAWQRCTENTRDEEERRDGSELEMHVGALV